MKLMSIGETAEQHKAADAACGRSWVCACSACRSVRYIDSVVRPKAKKPRRK